MAKPMFQMNTLRPGSQSSQSRFPHLPLTCGRCHLCSARPSPPCFYWVRFFTPDVNVSLMCLVFPVGWQMPGAGVLTFLLWP